MEDPASADAEGAAQPILLKGLLRSVDAKVYRVLGDLVETRRHLQEVVRLAERGHGELRAPNPLRADVDEFLVRARALLALPALSLLDYY